MMNTSTVMTVKTAHKVLQRALQLLLAVVALLIALLVQSISSHANAASDPPLAPEIIRLINEERLTTGPFPFLEETSMITATGLHAREAARRFSHTRPGGSMRNIPFLDFEIVSLRS